MRLLCGNLECSRKRQKGKRLCFICENSTFSRRLRRELDPIRSEEVAEKAIELGDSHRIEYGERKVTTDAEEVVRKMERRLFKTEI